ncbi:MAG: hypothetical protein ABF497_05290 [Sporolactobacillus sp.]
MDRNQMVDKLNELQHQLQNETRAVERERLQLSIAALTEAVRKSVREHNERRELDEHGSVS